MKKKIKSKIKGKEKLFIIIISSILLIGIITSIVLYVSNNKENTIISVNSIEKLTPLTSSSPAEAAELIKSNTVKIINQIDDETQLIGTGFFHESGYLVTNSHLVDIEGDVTIEYSDGEKQEAQLVSNDITSDIALLAVSNPKIKAMYFGNTLSLKVTDEVYAIGYPYALEGEASVSKGILSARRSAGGIEFLQSDISLNTGNSGGPLINDLGELLGINTYATENASIGMSISTESLNNIINTLINNKEVNYIEEERETNALSVVLTEIGYEHTDMYHEKDILEKIWKHKKRNNKDDDNDNEEDTKEDNNKSNNNNKKNNNDNDEVNDEESTSNQQSKNYTIEVSTLINQYPVGTQPSTSPNNYVFKLGGDLTNCKVDLSKVNINKVGTYDVEIKCDQNSAKTQVKMYGDFSIVTNETIAQYKVGEKLSTLPNNYVHSIGYSLTNCKVDLSKVNVNKPGTYDIEIKCDQNSAKTQIEIYAYYDIKIFSTIQKYNVGTTPSTDPMSYASLGSDLTNCKVDLSKVDINTAGTYDFEIKCDQNSAKSQITMLGPIPPNTINIPTITMDSTKNNVTNINQVNDTIWYYPGYADICQVFRFKIDEYDWTSLRMNQFGKIKGNYGGGIQYETFENMMESLKLWRQGNFLVVTYGGTSYTLTSIKGTGYYTNQNNDCELINF